MNLDPRYLKTDYDLRALKTRVENLPQDVRARLVEVANDLLAAKLGARLISLRMTNYFLYYEDEGGNEVAKKAGVRGASGDAYIPAARRAL